MKATICEHFKKMSGKRQLIDSLALALPPLALALILLLPLTWEFDVIIFYFFIALTVFLLGFGLFKKQEPWGRISTINKRESWEKS